MRTAVITGASSGIGQAYAERLAQLGHDLLVVARRKDRLDALAKRLASEGKIKVEVIAADLADPEQLAKVERRVAAMPEIELLVNNAGFGAYMPFEKLPPERAAALINVHVMAATRLARAALPAMIRRGQGSIVNVASMLAFSASLPPEPLPNRVVYASAKAYLVAFSQALAAEVGPSGVKVQALCPGIVATEFHVVQGAPGPLPGAMDPADVVSASLRGLELGEIVCAPTFEDAAALRAVAEAGRSLFAGRPGGGLASRYRT
jgi:uncharacterized protein